MGSRKKQGSANAKKAKLSLAKGRVEVKSSDLPFLADEATTGLGADELTGVGGAVLAVLEEIGGREEGEDNNAPAHRKNAPATKGKSGSTKKKKRLVR